MSDSGAIVMAVFRPDPRLLRRQVASLRAQTHDNWKCHVGIDGRDPEIAELLEKLVGDDPRFRITEYAENVGHYRNFERLSKSVPRSASWIAYCDQDDYWCPEKLDRLVEQLNAQIEVAAVVGAARVVDHVGAVIGLTQRGARSYAQLLLKNEVTGSFAIFRPRVLELALPFPEETRAAVHDHWIGACAAALGEVLFYDEPLQDYVQHSGNAIGEARASTIRSHVAAAQASGGLSAYLDGMSRDQWGWRVAMARTLLVRLNPTQQERFGILHAVGRGRLSLELIRRLGVEILTRRIPPRTGLAMIVAALWWPRATQGAESMARFRTN